MVGGDKVQPHKKSSIHNILVMVNWDFFASPWAWLIGCDANCTFNFGPPKLIGWILKIRYFTFPLHFSFGISFWINNWTKNVEIIDMASSATCEVEQYLSSSCSQILKPIGPVAKNPGSFLPNWSGSSSLELVLEVPARPWRTDALSKHVSWSKSNAWQQ